MAAAAASTSNASQALNLDSARVQHSVSAMQARCSRKSGKTSLFRRLVPRFLASCLPVAPAPAAKAPRPEVGSPNICCLAAQQCCVLCVIVCLSGMAWWQQRQQGCHCICGMTPGNNGSKPAFIDLGGEWITFVAAHQRQCRPAWHRRGAAGCVHMAAGLACMPCLTDSYGCEHLQTCCLSGPSMLSSMLSCCLCGACLS